LSADAGRNVIFGYHPRTSGAGYDLGKRENFIISLNDDNTGYVWNDSAQLTEKEKWFRPSDVTIGTDGAIYIADWYDPVVGGHQMKDSLGYGRIYRITPKGKKLLPPPIDLSTVEGQLTALKSPAINVRYSGFEALRHQGEGALSVVKPLLQDENTYVRARATWLLSQLGPGGEEAVRELLQHPDAVLRATAYRALRQTVTDILPLAQQMASDTSAFVRREVAVSLRDLPYAATKPVLMQLVKTFDGNDRWYLETLGACLDGQSSTIYPELVQLLGGGRPPAQWPKPLTALAWRLHPPEAINDLAARAADAALPEREKEAAITALGFVNDRRAVQAMATLAGNSNKQIAEGATYWLSFRQTNDWYKLADWTKVGINTAYERKLATMKVKKSIMLDERQSLNERKWRVQEMAGDSVGGQLLVGMAAEKQLPQVLLPFIEEKIFQNPSPAVRVQAGNYFRRPGTEVKYAIHTIGNLPADPQKGRLVFANRCASCHKMADEGGNIGPELTSIAKKLDRTELFDAIINPSAAIVFGYEAWLVNTTDGSSLYGFLLSENKQQIVLRDIGGEKHVVPLQKIKSRRKMEKSLMPDPASNGMSEQELADVVSYLVQAAGKR
jgi:putative heme-binding domain-containing protein